jgi:hypothetical protein
VAPYLLKLAAEQQQPTTVVEWPGFESEPGAILKVPTGPGIVRNVANGTRKSVPLGTGLPPTAMLGLPWFTPVELVEDQTGENLMYPLVGPAQHRSGGWQLPLVGGQEDLTETLKHQKEAREALVVLPRAWPPEKPAQEPHVWKAK